MSDAGAAAGAAGAAGTTAVGGTNTGGTGTQSWTDGFDGDLKAYVQTKGFTDPKALADSYRNFEKLQGVPKERLVQLPESLQGEAMNPIWERLGAVKEAKELSIEIPKEFGDEKLADFMKDTFHKLKVPRAMAEGFAKEFVARQQGMMKTETENVQFEVKTQYEAVKKEWGTAFDKNQNIANAAANKFGLGVEEVKALGQAMGPAGALKFLHKLGAGLGEGTFVDGSGSGGDAKTPDQAKSEINGLIKDTDFQRRIKNGDVDAKKKWDRLHMQANPQ